MRTLSTRNSIGLSVAALLLVAATVTTSATFRAPSPGATLEPTGTAAGLIQILQGNSTVLWTALSGPVTQIVTVGWPSKSGEVELAGAMVVERPDDPGAGIIEFGERPMSVTFDIEG